MPIVAGASPQPIIINVLGGFSVHRAGKIFSLPLGAQRLLSYMALAPRPVTRMELSGALWPDSTQRQASANLRTALWRIGQACGKGWLDTADGNLCLAGQAVVDIRDVSPVCQHLVTTGVTTRVTTGDVQAAPERGTGGATENLDSAVPDDVNVTRMCQRLLPGWHDDWLLIEQERWDQLRLHALEAASRLFSDRGNHVLAIETALISARSEPLRESAHRAVISAYLAEGNLGAALKHYRAFKEFLGRELGVAPTASMEALVRPLAASSRAATPR
jgi:DNA-binding SARP family transcriptional activator